MKRYEAQARLFKALMHPARLAIVDVLRAGEACVCHLEAALGYRQAYISQQLMVLREAGFVTDRREGWNIYYRVSAPEVFAVMDAVREPSGAPLNPRTAQPTHCPCPRCQSQKAK